MRPFDAALHQMFPIRSTGGLSRGTNFAERSWGEASNKQFRDGPTALVVADHHCRELGQVVVTH